MSDYVQVLLIILSAVTLYYFAKRLQQRYPNSFLNPTLVTSLGIIFVLFIFGTSYSGYMKGGDWINHILNAAVVCLTYPPYKNREEIRDSVSIIFTSALTGVMLSFMLIFLTLKAFGYSKDVIITLLPRSITVAIGIRVLHELGSTDTTTILFIIAAGLISSILGSILLRLKKFRSSIVEGLTHGNVLHAFGTARTLKTGIGSNAFNSIGMILAAVISSILVPVLILSFY